MFLKVENHHNRRIEIGIGGGLPDDQYWAKIKYIITKHLKNIQENTEDLNNSVLL